MSTREEDLAVDREMSIYTFSGPHTHLDWPVDADGNPTGETEMVWDAWTKSYREDFVRVERACDGCWY